MIEEKVACMGGKTVVRLIPENDADVEKLRKAIDAGGVDTRASFGDWKAEAARARDPRARGNSTARLAEAAPPAHVADAQVAVVARAVADLGLRPSVRLVSTDSPGGMTPTQDYRNERVVGSYLTRIRAAARDGIPGAWPADAPPIVAADYSVPGKPGAGEWKILDGHHHAWAAMRANGEDGIDVDVPVILVDRATCEALQGVGRRGADAIGEKDAAGDVGVSDRTQDAGSRVGDRRIDGKAIAAWARDKIATRARFAERFNSGQARDAAGRWTDDAGDPGDPPASGFPSPGVSETSDAARDLGDARRRFAHAEEFLRTAWDADSLHNAAIHMDATVSDLRASAAGMRDHARRVADELDGAAVDLHSEVEDAVGVRDVAAAVAKAEADATKPRGGILHALGLRETFDPDQPRDERGKFVASADAVERHILAADAYDAVAAMKSVEDDLADAPGRIGRLRQRLDGDDPDRPWAQDATLDKELARIGRDLQSARQLAKADPQNRAHAENGARAARKAVEIINRIDAAARREEDQAASAKGWYPHPNPAFPESSPFDPPPPWLARLCDGGDPGRPQDAAGRGDANRA